MANVERANRVGQEARQFGLGVENQTDVPDERFYSDSFGYRLDAATAGVEVSTAYASYTAGNNANTEEETEVIAGGYFFAGWEREEAFPDGIDFQPEHYGVLGVASHNAGHAFTTDEVWSGPTAGYFTATSQSTALGDVTAIFGVQARAFHAAAGTVPDLIGLGTLAGPSGPVAGAVTRQTSINTRLFFTAANATVGTTTAVRINGPEGALNNSTNHYGLHIGDQSTKGTSVSRNIYSAGATTVNEFVGRVVFGAPNSAIADAGLANSEASFYLDQAGNTLTVKAKYSDGTVKTGTIALV